MVRGYIRRGEGEISFYQPFLHSTGIRSAEGEKREIGRRGGGRDYGWVGAAGIYT